MRKKHVFGLMLAVVILIAKIIVIRSLITSHNALPPVEQRQDVVNVMSDADEQEMVSTTEDANVVFELAGGIRHYNNGIVSLEYDSDKLVFEEMPSDNETGVPFTSFVGLDSQEVLPRVDVLPLTLNESFKVGVSEEEWQSFAKSLLLAYYNQAEWETVVVSFTNPSVKVDEAGNAIMSVSYETTLDGSATPNLQGNMILQANDKNGVVIFAIGHKGKEIPPEYIAVLDSAAFGS